MQTDDNVSNLSVQCEILYYQQPVTHLPEAAPNQQPPMHLEPSVRNKADLKSHNTKRIYPSLYVQCHPGI